MTILTSCRKRRRIIVFKVKQRKLWPSFSETYRELWYYIDIRKIVGYIGGSSARPSHHWINYRDHGILRTKSISRAKAVTSGTWRQFNQPTVTITATNKISGTWPSHHEFFSSLIFPSPSSPPPLAAQTPLRTPHTASLLQSSCHAGEGVRSRKQKNSYR